VTLRVDWEILNRLQYGLTILDWLDSPRNTFNIYGTMPLPRPTQLVVIEYYLEQNWDESLGIHVLFSPYSDASFISHC
jgi:hypothetical protein